MDDLRDDPRPRARPRPRLATALLLGLLASLALGACASSGSGDHGDADVTFAQEMVPHHRQATEMAALAASRTDDEEVLDLAARIEAAQDPEIETMTGWLEEWGEDAPHDTSDMGHHGSSDMPGMMDADAMERLEQAEGDAFDELFLTMMVEHHEGAVEMAEVQVREGEHEPAVALAEDIRASQAAEIEEMEALLAR